MLEAGLATILWISVGLIAYQYVGYPLLVLLLARLRPRPDPSAHQPSVSLIIAAFNEQQVITRKVESSLQLAYPDMEVIVVADGSSDATVDSVSDVSDPRLRILHDPARRGKAMALNRGAAVATGEILVFSDANAFYEPNAISALVAPYSQPNVALVSGCKRVQPGASGAGDVGFGKSEGLYWHYEDRLRRAESRLGCTVATVGEILSIRASVFRPFPAGVVNDDAFLALDVLKRGYDVRYAPGAVSVEAASLSDADERVRRRRISAGRWVLFANTSLWPWRRPFVLLALFSHKWLRLLLPFLFVLALLANMAAVLLAPAGAGLWLLLAAQFVFYVAAWLGKRMAFKVGMAGRLARLCHFVVASNISVFLGFIDWIMGKGSPLWEKAER